MDGRLHGWKNGDGTLQTLCEQTVVMGWNASSWQHTHMKICSILRRKFFRFCSRDKTSNSQCCVLLYYANHHLLVSYHFFPLCFIYLMIFFLQTSVCFPLLSIATTCNQSKSLSTVPPVTLAASTQLFLMLFVDSQTEKNC